MKRLFLGFAVALLIAVIAPANIRAGEIAITSGNCEDLWALVQQDVFAVQQDEMAIYNAQQNGASQQTLEALQLVEDFDAGMLDYDWHEYDRQCY